MGLSDSIDWKQLRPRLEACNSIGENIAFFSLPTEVSGSACKCGKESKWAVSADKEECQDSQNPKQSRGSMYNSMK